jgi:transcriptional regulator with XRE-family HTH domain
MTMVLVREAVGQTLRAARTEQGRTLRDVARDARVSLGYLSEVERGQKEASSELLNAICAALGLSLSGVFAQVASELKSR